MCSRERSRWCKSSKNARGPSAPRGGLPGLHFRRAVRSRHRARGRTVCRRVVRRVRAARHCERESPSALASPQRLRALGARRDPPRTRRAGSPACTRARRSRIWSRSPSRQRRGQRARPSQPTQRARRAPPHSSRGAACCPLRTPRFPSAQAESSSKTLGTASKKRRVDKAAPSPAAQAAEQPRRCAPRRTRGLAHSPGRALSLSVRRARPAPLPLAARAALRTSRATTLKRSRASAAGRREGGGRRR